MAGHVLRGEWRVATDENYCGPHFRLDCDEQTWFLYIDGVEWCLRCEMPPALPLSRAVKLAEVLAIVPQLRAEAVGMTRAVLADQEAALRRRLLDALAALNERDYERANHLLDDLPQPWQCEHAAEDLREADA